MKKKTMIGGVLAGLFMMLAGYAAADAVQDTWTMIETPGEAVGIWKGTVESVIPAGALTPEAPAVVLDFIMTAAYESGAEQVVVKLSVGTSALLDTLLKLLPADATITKDSLWLKLMDELADSGMEASDAGGYYMGFTTKQPVEEFIASDEDGQMLINQDGTKIKWALSTPFTMGIGDSGFSEMVFLRQ
ncbi:MAG: hypothetical protein LBG10_04195 [Treponema sp.]|jgi:hypothetical protein|nr:hypothetical protein [Treponema sp.]